jgi:hypothetical protein
MIIAMVLIGLLCLLNLLFLMICIGTVQQSRNEMMMILQNIAMHTSLDDARLKELEKQAGLRIY